jgi:glycosyltransferase involved in cell wall biosynthesis
MVEKLRVLMIAPHISREATGEGLVAFKFAEALSPIVHLTVASFQSPRHTLLASQLPDAEVVTWPQPEKFLGRKRFRSMFKPDWLLFYRHIRKFMRQEAARFDIAHQVMPLAMRYPSPLRGQGLPYVIGPVGGSLPTNPAFASEATGGGWFTHLRKLDGLRLRFDPWLRASFADASLVLGVAPYVRQLLDPIQLKSYEEMIELGIDALPENPVAPARDRPLRLLHVGRVVRTKALRDVIRALRHLRDLPGLTLTSAGEGEDLDACRREASSLGLEESVRFLGLLPRPDVEKLYQEADIFVFPSFREPTGNVLFEAMRWGLPVIAANYGGPASIVDETCGLMIEVTEPDQFAYDIAAAIRRLVGDASLRQQLGSGAQDRVALEVWPSKAARLESLYRRTLDQAKS